jgi:type II secretory pathway pseudopilin PulG
MMALSVRRSERGVTLAEVLIALFILGFVGVAVIAGVFTTVKSNETARTRITAESLARSELEYVNSQAYTTLYPGTPTSSSWDYTLPRDPPDPPRWDSLHNGLPWDYAGYEITVSSAEKATGIQKITAVVRDVNKDVDILTIETYRAKY